MRWGLIVLCAAWLSALTVHYQMAFMGLEWYETVQWGRTQQVIRGESGTPWQYRLFTESLVYGAVRACEAAGVPRPVGTAFVAVRLVQNFLVFVLAVAFYRRLGISTGAALLGTALLGYGMCHALYDGDLTFNTYTDMALFLAAGLLIASDRIAWLVPLMIVAAFNRETSGCIPIMLLCARRDARALRIALACVAVWIAIVGGLRLAYGVRPYIVPTAGVAPILPLLTFNLTWWRTWVFLFATLGLLPLMALAAWRRWPPLLRRFCWAVVPVWFPVHFALAHAPETRLFLVPQVLVFVPGALCALGMPGGRGAGAPPPPRDITA